MLLLLLLLGSFRLFIGNPKIKAPAAAIRGAQTSKIIPTPTFILSLLLLGQDAAGLDALVVAGGLVEGPGGNYVRGTSVFPGADAQRLVI